MAFGPIHPYAATLAQMRKPAKEGGVFASLNDQQKREWHADVYAFNRIVLGRDGPNECNSTPADPRGEWRDEGMIEIAGRYWRAKKEPCDRQREMRGKELEREGRNIVNRWTQQQGCVDIDSYAAAKDITITEAYVAYLRSPEYKEIMAAAEARIVRDPSRAAA